MATASLTDAFIDRIYEIGRTEIPDTALAKLRFCLLDYLGVVIGGRSAIGAKEEKLDSLMGGCGNSSVLGSSKKTSLTNAILMNGLSSHFLELDDGVRYGVVHPGAPIFSALLPVAEKVGTPWDDFARGAVAGYEAAIRIAWSMQPYHYSRGFHPTATCCPPGVAAGLCIMLRSDKKVLKDAFSAAAVSAYGTLKVIENASQLKPYNSAHAALSGYTAACMAMAGFAGPDDVLGGKTGFLRMMSSEYDEDILLSPLGRFGIERVYLKPYASCRHTHPGIEAAFRIRRKTGFDLSEIEKVEVITYEGVLGKHDGKEILGESSAKMSIPYSLAVALTTGKAGIREFRPPYVEDPSVLALARKVEVSGDGKLSELVPDKRVAVVNAVARDGTVFSETVEYPKGEPENPLDEKELTDKFLSLTEGGKTDPRPIATEILHGGTPDLRNLISKSNALW